MSNGDDNLETWITQSIADKEGDGNRMLSKWILVAEVLEEDGSRAIWLDSSEGLTRWESLGMLEHARLTEQSAAIREDREDNGDV